MFTRARMHKALPPASNFRRSHGESTFYFSSDNSHADFALHADLDQDMTVDVQETGGDPKTLHEARSHPDRPRWKEAMGREVETLEEAGTWITMARRDLDGCAKEAETASREGWSDKGKGTFPLGGSQERQLRECGERKRMESTRGTNSRRPTVSVGRRRRSKHGRPWGEFAE